MAQLIIYTPDSLVVDNILITDSLAAKLTDVLKKLKRKSLDLVLLRDIKLRALSTITQSLKEQNIKIDNVQEIQGFATSSTDWFGSLLAVIEIIEQKPNADSLTIQLSK